EPEPFNLTAHKGELVAGHNVLAIQGLNASPADASFLVLPELTGGVALIAENPFYFESATPGAINATPTSQGKVADTRFDPDRGIYDAPLQVTVSTETAGATIRYTTDGSEPTETHGTIYAGPITVNATTTLRAAAFRTGYDPTNIDTHTYVLPDSVLAQAPGNSAPGWPAGSVN
ncbi:MAG: chitobiase/beta-hexosaminidase C-terminal domain-containing protein, partial [Planctomycetales bacterium]|nr:chitobiase/beta-hexosaminidase C-terminal domain-containing protein [Planctomycetales bacterium]